MADNDKLTIAFIRTVSMMDVTCERCLDLGLPPNGILADSEYFLVVIANKIDSACCEDYFERWREQCK